MVRVSNRNSPVATSSGVARNTDDAEHWQHVESVGAVLLVISPSAVPRGRTKPLR